MRRFVTLDKSGLVWEKFGGLRQFPRNSERARSETVEQIEISSGDEQRCSDAAKAGKIADYNRSAKSALTQL